LFGFQRSLQMVLSYTAGAANQGWSIVREAHSPASRMSFGVNFSHFDEPDQKATMTILCRWNRSF